MFLRNRNWLPVFAPDAETGHPQFADDLGERAEQVAALLGDDDGAGGASEQNSASTADADAGRVEKPVTAREEGTPDPGSPVIEPPDSWKAEAKERFRTLPPDVQQVIAEREAESKAAFNRQINEAAEARKAAEAEKQAVAQERQRYVSQAAQFVNDKYRVFQSEFADVVKGETSPTQLQEKDPMRYLRFQAMQSEIALAENSRQQAAMAMQQEEEARIAVERKSHREKLIERFPEWKDEAKAKAADRELRDYAVSQGIPAERYAQTYDSSALTILTKAMRYDKLLVEQKAAAAKKVVPLPQRTVKPGTSNDAGDGERLKALAQRARKSDRFDDRAAYVLAKLDAEGL